MASGSQRLEKCIFGISVKQGTVAIGLIQLILVVVGFLAGVSELIDSYDNDDRIRIVDTMTDNEEFIKLKKWRESREAVMIMAMCGLLYAVLMGLLIGVYKKRHSLMYPWIFVHTLLVVLLFTATFLESWDRGIQSDVFQQIIMSAVGYYCLLIVSSHYQDIRDMHENNYNRNILSQQNPIDSFVNEKPVMNNNNIA